MNILLIGATSVIAQETARCFAKDSASFFLVARSKEKLEIVAADLRARGARRVEISVLDLDHPSEYKAMIESAYSAFPVFDVVLMAHGLLTQQQEASEDPEKTMACMFTNATSVMALVAHLLPRLKQAKEGTLGVISSVAGDRGRATLYTYSAAKAALTVFLQGVRGELLPFGVNVLTIKPGYVDTRMVAHVQKSFLFASPVRVGQTIYEALKAKKNGEMYTPWFWWWIMTPLNLLPEWLFLRLPI